jgi:hypothetical protein
MGVVEQILPPGMKDSEKSDFPSRLVSKIYGPTPALVGRQVYDREQLP